MQLTRAIGYDDLYVSEDGKTVVCHDTRYYNDPSWAMCVLTNPVDGFEVVDHDDELGKLLERQNLELIEYTDF